MRTRPLLALVAILLALLLGPIEARLETPRTVSTDVVPDDRSLVAITLLSPVLTENNTYTDAAMTLTHKHVSSITLSLSVTTNDARFSVRNGEAELSHGERHTVSVHAPGPEPPGTYVVDLTVSSDVHQDGQSTGRQQATRTLTVTVE